jgi:hypothetical protein
MRRWMINYPFTIQNVLPIEKFITLSDELERDWSLTNFSDNINYSKYKNFWGMREKENDLLLIDCGITIKFKIQKFLRRNIRLIRCHINGQTFGQSGKFHTDYCEDNTWTFILFCSKHWSTNWGGEFVCHNPIENKYEYVPYIPNTGCLVPANWEHYGSSPNDQTDKLRVSVGFSYCEEKKYNEMKSKFEIKL